MSTRASPFHVRMADHNTANAWVMRGPYTLAAHYGDAREETLAARFGAAMMDMSAMSRLRIHGAGATKLLSAATGTDAEAIAAGSSARVIWRNEAGGVRGTGLLARFAANGFLLTGDDTDGAWFESAASHFDATVRDEANEKGVLMLAGPIASDIAVAAGLDKAAGLGAGQHVAQPWRGLTVTVSRWSVLSNALGGCEISCAADDALMVFDRLWRAGPGFGLMLAGQDALETLLLEQGMVIPNVDYKPARDALARTPSPASLGIGGFADAPGAAQSRVLAGLELESDTPMAFAPVIQNGAVVGASLRSAYSPALRRAIALAQLDPAIGAGAAVSVRRLTPHGATEDVPARVTDLPFLKST